MLDFALDHARKMGFETEDHEGYCGSAIYGDKNNALGIIAHIDVVPEGEQWIYPPYGATRVGDFLIGRGTNDDKNAAVLGLYLMRMFRELGTPLKHGLRVIMGCSEETGMEDMEYYVQNCVHPVASLIPDSMFPANYAQKGSIKGPVLHGRRRADRRIPRRRGVQHGAAQRHGAFARRSALRRQRGRGRERGKRHGARARHGHGGPRGPAPRAG